MKNSWFSYGDEIGINAKNSRGEMEEFLIDADDFEKIDALKGTFYIMRGYIIMSKRESGKRVSILLHRVITNCPSDRVVDHINRNRLDNRKVNLRIVTPKENAQNRGPNSNSISGVRGVGYVKSTKRWRARLKIGDTTREIGSFRTKEEAEEVVKKARIAVMRCSEEATKNPEKIKETKIWLDEYIAGLKHKGRLDGKTGIKGVSWHNHAKKWLCQMQLNGKRKTAYFDDYNKAVRTIREWRENIEKVF